MNIRLPPRGGAALLPLLLSACSASGPRPAPQPAPPPQVVTEVEPSSTTVVERTQAWTPAPDIGQTPMYWSPPETWTFLPVAADQLGYVEAGEPYSARLGNRIVWLDLRDAMGRALLDEVEGPVMLQIDPMVVEMKVVRGAIDRLSRRFAVGIHGENLNFAPEDGGLLKLEGLPIQSLDLRPRDWLFWVNRVSPAWRAEHLAQFSELRHLSLRETNVSAEGLAHLSGLRALRTLDLGGIADDEGLVHLTELRQLRQLNLHRGRVTDEGLKHVALLRELRHLDLSDTQITDEALKSLAGLNELRSLDLRNTAITGTGISHLGSLPQLSALDLSGTRIDDEGLRAFVHCPNSSDWSSELPARIRTCRSPMRAWLT